MFVASDWVGFHNKAVKAEVEWSFAIKVILLQTSNHKLGNSPRYQHPQSKKRKICEIQGFRGWIAFSFSRSKLDGVGPLITDPPPTSFTTLSKKRRYIFLMVTCDMWRVTCDMCHMTGGRRWTFSQNFRSLALTAWEWRYLKNSPTYTGSDNK